MPRPTRRTRLLVAAAATAVAAALVPAALVPTADASTAAFVPQLVTVDTPTRADKRLLQTLGLDLTEHAGHDYVEVVLHTAAEADLLQAAGLTYDARIPDLVAREAANNRVNAQYAAATAVSPLPSGRDTYRSLADYNADMKSLAQANPSLVRLFELPRPSLDGRTVYGIEVAENVAAKDGRPTFVLLGLHHAREWPSGEHAIEFAIDMVNGYKSGDPRRKALLQQGRLVVVPVVNVDGFQLSYEDGQKVDLRETGDQTVTVIGTPGNAYKRKNCRVLDGQDTVDGTCAAFSATSPGGYGVGVDLNRNYGGLWGGPGAADLFADPTYRGGGPFSEPETQNIRDLIAGRQVTMMISNHTFSNLVLRPNGVDPQNTGPDGKPVGDAPDEDAMKALGADMTAQNGYRNIHGWQLYDTTGTTEDWSYNATGGFGYTFEIGPNEFHPPVPEVVDEYLGAGPFAGKGNRAAYLLAFEEAVDRTGHSVLAGKAPKGATLRLTKQFETQTWDNQANFTDRLDSTMVVGSSGKFTWDVNPSTRPAVSKRLVEILGSEPVRTQEYRDRPAPLFNQYAEEEFTLTESGLDLLKVDLTWTTSAADDLDLVVYWVDPTGRRVEVGSSGNAPGQAESAKVVDPEPGTYVFEVHNYASTTPTYDIVASLYDAVGTEEVGAGIAEWWTLSCEKPTATGLKVLEQRSVYVERGQQVKVDLAECARRWKSAL